MIRDSFDKDKCQILQVETKDKRQDYRMHNVKTKNVQYIKDLGAKITSNFKFLQHCTKAANKVNGNSGFIKRDIMFKTKIFIFLPQRSASSGTTCGTPATRVTS